MSTRGHENSYLKPPVGLKQSFLANGNVVPNGSMQHDSFEASLPQLPLDDLVNSIQVTGGASNPIKSAHGDDETVIASSVPSKRNDSIPCYARRRILRGTDSLGRHRADELPEGLGVPRQALKHPLTCGKVVVRMLRRMLSISGQVFLLRKSLR